MDKKHQIVVDAQAFGEGQEHHTLAPVLESIEARFKRLGISDDIYATGTVVTVDTGFANEKNMKYLHESKINAYVPDNRFRSRDPKFSQQKESAGPMAVVLYGTQYRETGQLWAVSRLAMTLIGLIKQVIRLMVMDSTNARVNC